MLVDGAGAGARATRPTRTSLASSSSTSSPSPTPSTRLGGTGLWDEEDGFYYDQLLRRRPTPSRCGCARWSGIIPLFAVEVLDEDVIDEAARLPQARCMVPREPPDLAQHISYHGTPTTARRHAPTLLAIPSRERLRAGAALRAGRERVSLAATASARCRSSPQRPALTCCSSTARSTACDYEPGESQHRPVRRQLELARAGLVSGQLPADRSARALPPLLRRRR